MSVHRGGTQVKVQVGGVPGPGLGGLRSQVWGGSQVSSLGGPRSQVWGGLRSQVQGGPRSQVQGGPRSRSGGVPCPGPGMGGYPVSVKGKIFDTRFGLIHV